jgi:hypothetical protein
MSTGFSDYQIILCMIKSHCGYKDVFGPFVMNSAPQKTVLYFFYKEGTPTELKMQKE